MSSVRRVIENWKFDHVKSRLVNCKGWSPTQANLVEGEYRKYLHLLSTNPGEKFPVPEKVDEFGHIHLLFTQDAQAFEQASGIKLHHEPLMHPNDVEALMPSYVSRTLNLLQRMFGDLNGDIWSARCVCTWQCIPFSA